MNTRKMSFWVTVAGFLVFIGVAIVQICRQIHQDNLDHALIQAVKTVDVPAVNRLLGQGASADACDNGEPPLTFPRLMVRLRLQLQGKTVSSVPTTSALNLALADTRLYTVEYIAPLDSIAVALIKHGANPHFRWKDNRTTLDVAALHSMDETVRLLLSLGADVNSRDDFGSTPLMHADMDAANLLLGYGADVHAKDHSKCTPLHFALSRASPAHVELLIANGADVNAADSYGYSILYRAMELQRVLPGNAEIYEHRAEITRLLQRHGARLNKIDKERLRRDQSDRPNRRLGARKLARG